MAELLIYSALSISLLSILLFFYAKSSDYYLFVSDKIKLSKLAKLCTRSLTRDLQHATPSRIVISTEGQGQYVVIDQAEGYTPDGHIIWSDKKVCYAFVSDENTVYRWLGEKSQLAEKLASKEYRSWPYIDKFALSQTDLRTLNFDIGFLYEDLDQRFHRYDTKGAINLAGGQNVR